MIRPDQFRLFVTALETANNLTHAAASRYAVLIGDTPEVEEDGRVIVRDDDGTILARVVIPNDQAHA